MPEWPPSVVCVRCDGGVTVDTAADPPEVGCFCESRSVKFVLASAVDSAPVPDTWCFRDPRAVLDE